VTYHRGGCQERNALENGIELHACGCDGVGCSELGRLIRELHELCKD
jgi:hypothetical protein